VTGNRSSPGFPCAWRRSGVDAGGRAAATTAGHRWVTASPAAAAAAAAASVTAIKRAVTMHDVAAVSRSVSARAAIRHRHNRTTDGNCREIPRRTVRRSWPAIDEQRERLRRLSRPEIVTAGVA